VRGDGKVPPAIFSWSVTGCKGGLLSPFAPGAIAAPMPC